MKPRTLIAGAGAAALAGLFPGAAAGSSPAIPVLATPPGPAGPGVR